MSQQCKFCETENEDSAEHCTECGTDLNLAPICPKCETKYPIEVKHCSKCGAQLFIPLAVSDSIKFKRIGQVVRYLFDIRKKDGSKFDRNFKFRECEYDKSENEKVWFPKLVGDKNWKNEILDNGKTFKSTYIGNDPEYIAKLKKKGKINKSENLWWYIFAKFEDNSYHFIGKFKIDKIVECEKSGSYEAFYKRNSEVVFLENRRDVEVSIKRILPASLKGQVLGHKSSEDSTPKKSS